MTSPPLKLAAAVKTTRKFAKQNDDPPKSFALLSILSRNSEKKTGPKLKILKMVHTPSRNEGHL